MPDWYMHVRGALLFLQGAVAMQLFAYPLRRRDHFLLRAGLTGSACALVAYLGGTWIHLKEYQGVAPILVYLLLILTANLLYRETFFTALFVASSGYVAQDLAGSLKMILKLFPVTGGWARDPLGVLLVDAICYGGMYTVLFFSLRPFTRRRNENFDNKLKAVFSFGVLLLCIGMARLTQDNPERNFLAQFAECLYAMICDAFVLLLQFGVMERARLSQNVDEMRRILQKQRDQYEAGKSSMELVNEKYHDLKALLRSFHGQLPPAQMQKLEHQVQEYDVYIHTGNAALDVLLTERRALCARRGIQLTCLLHGPDLAFVEELDLYTLFGNALDNAIEAVSQLPPEREKFISMTGTREGNLVTVHMENPFAGALTFQDGLPRSARDPRYHGFGMRSMERIVQNYGGTLTASGRDGLFCLDLLLAAPAPAP